MYLLFLIPFLLVLAPPVFPSSQLPYSTISVPHPYLPRNTTLNIHLLGTAHVSPTSATEVSNVLDTGYPSPYPSSPSRPVRYCCLELCHERAPGMLDTVHRTLQGIPSPPGTGGGLLGALQSQYAGMFNVSVGCDFLACLQHAVEHPKEARVFLIDRPVTVTLARAKSSLTRWGKVRFGAGLVWDLMTSPFQKKKVERFLKEVLSGDGDLLTKELEKLRGKHPTLYETVVEERDAWLGFKICQCADAVAGHEGGEMRRRAEEGGGGGGTQGGGDVDVLCVVGKGHCEKVSSMIREYYANLPSESGLVEMERRRQLMRAGVVGMAGRVYGAKDKDAGDEGWEGWVDNIVEVNS